MPSTGQRGARSRLADVLADIRNSRSEDDVNSSSRPTPAKRRSTVNYVALSGHTPRQSRSSTANSLNISKSNKTGLKEQPLYPIIRAWAQVRSLSMNGLDHDFEQTKNDAQEKITGPSQTATLDGNQQESHNNKNSPSQDLTRREAPDQIVNNSTKQYHRRKERGSVDIICSNLLHSIYRN